MDPTQYSHEDPHIRVPANWNPQLDAEYKTAAQSHAEACKGLIDTLATNMAEHHDLIDCCIGFFLLANTSPCKTAIRLLPIHRKIEILLDLVRASPVSLETELFLEEDLKLCSKTEALAQTFLERSVSDPSKVWLRELFDLGDCFAHATIQLGETMMNSVDAEEYLKAHMKDPFYAVKCPTAKRQRLSFFHNCFVRPFRLLQSFLRSHA